MVCSIGSFTTGLPSKFSVVAIDETVARKIRKTELDDICRRFPVFHEYVRKIIEGQTLTLENHYMRFTLPARERLRRLSREDSWVLADKRIKDYMVASFLGMDRATYSRVRGR